MTAKEIQKRNAKAESLRVLQADDGSFYVESEKGKILYNVILDDEESRTAAPWVSLLDDRAKIVASRFGIGEFDPYLFIALRLIIATIFSRSFMALPRNARAEVSRSRGSRVSARA